MCLYQYDLVDLCELFWFVSLVLYSSNEYNVPFRSVAHLPTGYAFFLVVIHTMMNMRVRTLLVIHTKYMHEAPPGIIHKKYVFIQGRHTCVFIPLLATGENRQTIREL